MSFFRDLRVAFYSLMRTQGLALTVILTLALGIGANAAIFTLVRGVLLKPLVNRDEDRLIYIRQSAPGVGDDNSTFSVPEIQDLRASVKTLSAFGDFSTTEFTTVLPPSSASSNPPSPIPKIRNSSPTLSLVRITSLQPWSLAASIA